MSLAKQKAQAARPAPFYADVAASGYGRRTICFISVILPALAIASSSEIKPALKYLMRHWFIVCMPQKLPSAIAE